jgi:hypothetical protein
LKAGAAQDRPALIRLEGHGCFRPTLRAHGSHFPPVAFGACGPLRLAFLAVFWIVDKLFGLEKELLVGCENEIFATNDALQGPIGKDHLRLSDTG